MSLKKADFCKAITEQHDGKIKKSSEAIIQGASQNHGSHQHAKTSVTQCFGINDPFDLPQIKKKKRVYGGGGGGGGEQPLQPPSLHCNFSTKAGVMLQSTSSQLGGRRWVE